MKNIISLLILIAIIIGGYLIYNKYIEDKTISIIEGIEHELYQTEEFVFSRDNMKFSQIQNNKVFLAQLNYLYTWEANVPFGFSSKDIQLNYDNKNDVLNINVQNLRLFDFKIHNQKSKKTHVFMWMDQGDPAKKFWEGINKHTEKLINKELKNNSTEVNNIKSISQNSLIISIQNILKKLELNDTHVNVTIDNLILYNGKKV